MYLVNKDEMSLIIQNVVDAICTKADELGLEEGVVTICYNEAAGSGYRCFDDSLGGDISQSFSVKDGCSFLDKIADDMEDRELLSIAMMKIAVATELFKASRGKQMLSSDSGIIGYSGCVMYPLTINDDLCGKIYVSVAAGTPEQSEEIAWQAYEPIINGLIACKTTNPGPDSYCR